MNKKHEKIGLALGGGSTYGIAHIGVLAALEEAGIPIGCVSGTSAGALVAACYAFGMKPAEMTELSRSLNWKKLSRFAYSRLGFRTNAPMATFLTDALGDVRIENADIPLAIVATNIETHQMIILRTGPVEAAVRASTCLPGFFTPVEIDGQLLVDGGLTENVPLTALDEMGATMKIAVNLLSSAHLARPKNVIDVLNMSVEILSVHRDKHIAHAADIVIEPNLAVFNSMDFKDTERVFAAGLAAGRKAIPLIRARMAQHVGKAPSLAQRFFSLFRSR